MEKVIKCVCKGDAVPPEGRSLEHYLCEDCLDDWARFAKDPENYKYGMAPLGMYVKWHNDKIKEWQIKQSINIWSEK